MVHRISWRVADAAALDFWELRLASAGVGAERGDGSLRLRDPDGLQLELVCTPQASDGPLCAHAGDIPSEHALLGFAGARAYSAAGPASDALLAEALGFEREGDESWTLAGERRESSWAYDAAPAAAGAYGAGSVHHIAWASRDSEQEGWREAVLARGLRATPIIDRDYFRSVYFREPSGVLFEIATCGPGFAIDEDPEHLGESLRLPRQHEHLRAELERKLTPLSNPRATPAAAGGAGQ
jgi:glyoxalase family protein